MLSFLVDDYLAENEFFGARAVLLSSASSKTAFGLAHLLHRLRKEVRVIGLTSTGNVDFVRSLGCYDDVVTYESVTSLPPDTPVAYVDMAGNSGLRETLHRHFGEQQNIPAGSGSPTAPHRRTSRPCRAPGRAGSSRPTRFASGRRSGAPAASIRVSPQLGPALPRSWSAGLRWPKAGGPDAVKRVYLDTLNGRVPPQLGHILSLGK
jgi:hypothetical protein